MGSDAWDVLLIDKPMMERYHYNAFMRSLLNGTL
jgi:hypothetical protein